MTDQIVFDELLTPDRDADEELSFDSDIRTLSDSEIAGARFQLNCETSSKESGTMLAQLKATFQPPSHLRVSYAVLKVTIKKPDSAFFQRVGPAEVREEDPVKVSRESSQKFSPKFVEKGSSEVSTALRYHLPVTGSGDNSPRAIWQFRENEIVDSGIPTKTELELVIASDGPITCEMVLMCRIVRRGAAGAVDGMRDLIIGPRPNKTHRAQIVIG